ncbi:DUF6086 family protein [Streptomyces boluensis]|uniref:Uncharacterized protein n=1 Tax=Streptomyces boluensis TaxID=1775135 RepID=A0A964XJZ7_9ACTN|nr:DUF6086 family protein [Streptomyces boluensis]NBE50571.1 hypothetical protein [Streptomyces boluensis]
MSQYFECDGVTLWNPSNGVAGLFLRQVALYEVELGSASGIGPMEDDEATVDPLALRAFATALLARYGRTRHPVLMALSDGFVATALVLADRAGAAPAAEAFDAAGAARAAVLRERAQELGRAMHG